MHRPIDTVRYLLVLVPGITVAIRFVYDGYLACAAAVILISLSSFAFLVWLDRKRFS